MEFSHCKRAIAWSVTSITGKNTEPKEKLSVTFGRTWGGGGGGGGREEERKKNVDFH